MSEKEELIKECYKRLEEAKQVEKAFRENIKEVFERGRPDRS